MIFGEVFSAGCVNVAVTIRAYMIILALLAN